MVNIHDTSDESSNMQCPHCGMPNEISLDFLAYAKENPQKSISLMCSSCGKPLDTSSFDVSGVRARKVKKDRGPSTPKMGPGAM